MVKLSRWCHSHIQWNHNLLFFVRLIKTWKIAVITWIQQCFSWLTQQTWNNQKQSSLQNSYYTIIIGINRYTKTCWLLKTIAICKNKMVTSVVFILNSFSLRYNCTNFFVDFRKISWRENWAKGSKKFTRGLSI